METDI